MPGPIEQSLTSLISYTWVMGLIQAQPHTFMENELKWVEHEKFVLPKSLQPACSASETS